MRLEVELPTVVVRRPWNREEARDVLQEALVRLRRMRARINWERVEPLERETVEYLDLDARGIHVASSHPLLPAAIRNGCSRFQRAR